MWRFKESEETEDDMQGCGWLHIRRITSINKKKRRFWMRPTLSKRKI
jgi:hypothetical protein